MGRYRKAGQVAGQVAIAAVIVGGVVISAALVLGLMFLAVGS
jgi:hypothetical protein